MGRPGPLRSNAAAHHVSAAAFGHSRVTGETGKILLTQQEVASFINVSRAQLAKMYGQLRKEGIIDTGNRFVTVLDEKKLQAYQKL